VCPVQHPHQACVHRTGIHRAAVFVDRGQQQAQGSDVGSMQQMQQCHSSFTSSKKAKSNTEAEFREPELPCSLLWEERNGLYPSKYAPSCLKGLYIWSLGNCGPYTSPASATTGKVEKSDCTLSSLNVAADTALPLQKVKCQYRCKYFSSTCYCITVFLSLIHKSLLLGQRNEHNYERDQVFFLAFCILYCEV
jgi:hypothetical protein